MLNTSHPHTDDVRSSTANDHSAEALGTLVQRCPPSMPLRQDSPRAQLWAAVESQIGTELPSDYRAFIDAYGHVRLDDFLQIFSPFAPANSGNLVTESTSVLSAYRTLRAAFADEMPLPAFPEPGGLLPFGRTDNGDDLYWRTIGRPDDWPIVIFGARERDHQQIDRNTTGLLLALLTGEVDVTVLPSSFPKPSAQFVAVD